MSNAFNRPTKPRKPAINLTSLIDVMFLLVIFLTVSTTFRDQLGIDVTLPEAGSAEITPMDQDAAIVVSAEGEYFFAGMPVDEAGLREALTQWAERETAPPIVLRVDESAPSGRMIRVLDIAREIGGTDLVIPTQPMAAPQLP